MSMDVVLATLQCQKNARKKFPLPRSFSVPKLEERLAHFGKKCEPIAVSLCPTALQYKSNAPLTIDSSGMERVIATYHTDFLDKNQYHLIFNSATANSKLLKGKKNYRFLDKSQKSAPLNRVTVVIIYAKRVDETLKSTLFDLVCKNGGDGLDTVVLPCVIDLEQQICTFDSMRIPYIAFQHCAKNRGIRLIRRYLFNGKLPLSDSKDTIEPMEGIDPEQSLWAFWKTTRQEIILDEKERKMRFEKMEHRDILFEDDCIYLKWSDRGIWSSIEINEESKIVEIDDFDSWDYPKSNKIAKDTIKEIKNLVDTYFSNRGYTTQYISFDE